MTPFDRDSSDQSSRMPSAVVAAPVAAAQGAAPSCWRRFVAVAQRRVAQAKRVRLSHEHGAAADEREQADVDQNDGEQTLRRA